MDKKSKTKMTLEKLAVMIADGFAETASKVDLEPLENDIAELKIGVVELKTDMSDVKLRLDYLAPKFEVRDLEKRVTKLEVKTGIRKS